jgi:hypothetical protein
MEDQDLHDLLEKFHSQIESTQTLDKENLEELRDLEKDIRALLDRSGAETVQSEPGILQRLEEAVGAFEVSHPVLATVINDVMVTLGNAGI